jgi:nicotinamide-nucleotide amidase
LREREQSFAVAESCTGGLVGQRITALPGSSAVFAGGVIAYHNDVKSGVLGVPVDLLVQHGAVSEPVASAMAEGVRQVTGADYGVALTGVAGPGGGTAEKPVGLVYVAVADARGTEVKMLRLGGGRETIRLGACFMALDLLRRRLT